MGREELDISDTDAVAAVFKRYRPVFFINTAAYTAVDKAETDQVNAYMINAEATGTIAMICSRYQTKLIHLSTDYVFDGNGSNPYKEDDIANPVNYYGFTKWTGEQLALKNNAGTIVIRTSWVYSIYGNNFVKTM
ncbi:MAG TPA: sugar nucleotide-binding protein, partial [Panacibacter sp.]|nr:sugar nucleotide-binding protein [Panacibacter sp.]